MKIFYDTEFIDTGKTIDLISIGMVREDGRELYAVADDRDVITRAIEHEWLRKNVVPSLPLRYSYCDPSNPYEWDTEFQVVFEWNDRHPDRSKVMDRRDIMREVRAFVLTTKKPQLWAWYGAYDHVAIAQLFGRMRDLPENFPMCTFDLKQEHVRLGSPALPRQAAGEHNALEDARHNARISMFLEKYEELSNGLR